jgi:hypothetical protein
MRVGFFLSLLLPLAIGCGSKTPETPASPGPEPKASARSETAKPKTEAASPPAEDDDQRVFFGREQGAEYFKGRGKGEKPNGYFTPTRAEIEKLEAGLPDMLREALRGKPATSPPLWERVTTYRRQYLAFVDAGGTHWIWGNFMCVNAGRVGSDAWRKRIVNVDDGGDCFFNVEYSPDTGKYRHFEINGDG